MKQVLIFLIIVLNFTACKPRNKLNTNEQKLVAEIKTEEQEKQAAEAALKQNVPSIPDTLPPGFRFQEDRSIDPNNPPLVIDIAGSLDNIETLKLSDVASTIKYIRIDALPDSTLPTNLKYKYYITDNNIVAINLYGIHLFSREGKFLQSIVKNEMTGISFDEKRDRIFIRFNHTKIGAGTSAWSKGDALFYEYSNNITGQRYIMKYDCSGNQSTINLGFDPENQPKIIGLGKIHIDLNHGNTKPPKPRKGNGVWDLTPESIYEQRSIYTYNGDTYIKPLRGKYMMGIINSKGDTLSTFTKLEQVKNYTKSVSRGTDHGTQYVMDGNLLFRTDFNDTVFQVIPASRLLPRYVLDLGKYKTSKLEGMNPDVSLEGKIIPMQWSETKNHIFFAFSKDNYDCPNNRKNKSVKIYHAIYSKQHRNVNILDSDPINYSPNILKNYIDGGVPVWPLSYQVANNNKILISLKGKELKTHVNSTSFDNSKVAENKKNVLKIFSDSIKNNDDILMIIQ